MLSNTDSMVGEYLIYRGFNNTFKVFDSERNKDRTKQFEIDKIVESIFNDLNNLSIEPFISLWDFLSKRFFLHLDAEHHRLSQILKSDLLKYYLVNTIKQKNKEKTKEFFTSYSYEILSESSETFGNLRGWYALPYIEDPEKDKEFAIYFTSKWIDSLRLTCHNFLSLVLHTAPLPKLLLLDRWFRSEAQQELRSQLDLSAHKINTLISKLEQNEERLCSLHDIINTLVTHVQKATISSSSTTQRTSNIGLFETDEEAEKKKIKLRELGQNVCRLANTCATKSSSRNALPIHLKLRKIIGKKDSSLFYQDNIIDNSIPSTASLNEYESNTYESTVEDVEKELIDKLQQWLGLI